MFIKISECTEGLIPTVNWLVRDVMHCVTSTYYDTFKQLEEEGKLDPLNETDVYCLHKVYLPRINSSLATVMVSWNHHPISSERNLPPPSCLLEVLLNKM